MSVYNGRCIFSPLMKTCLSVGSHQDGFLLLDCRRLALYLIVKCNVEFHHVGTVWRQSLYLLTSCILMYVCTG